MSRVNVYLLIENKRLLSIYYIPGTLPDSKNSAVNKPVFFFKSLFLCHIINK